MARVLLPVMPRRYDPNPRGSATKHVTMAGDNPFERRVTAVNGSARRTMLPGMGAIDLTPIAQTTAAAAGDATKTAASGGAIDWTSLAQKVGDSALKVGTTYAQNRIETLYGPKPQPLTGTAATMLPGQAGASYPPPPKKSSVLPWVLAGAGILAVGGVIIFLRRKKR